MLGGRGVSVIDLYLYDGRLNFGYGLKFSKLFNHCFHTVLFLCTSSTTVPRCIFYSLLFSRNPGLGLFSHHNASVCRHSICRVTWVVASYFLQCSDECKGHFVPVGIACFRNKFSISILLGCGTSSVIK